MEWNYIQPVEIIFGSGKISEVKNVIEDGKRGLIICDPFFEKNGLAEKILEESCGRILNIFSEISPNPEVEEVDKCAELIRNLKADFIVALGGGSALDLAKAAASISLTDDSIVNYHGTGKQFKEKGLPLIAIPTTSGTGSEVTSVSVLTDSKLGKKAPIASKNFYPDYAIIDPELTLTVPKEITASTGIDVLSHAIEGYWSVHNQPVCSAIALESIELILKNLEIAYKNPENLKAREELSMASVMAGLAFALPKTTASHACSYPLTSIYKIPHGEACGLTLDYFIRINKDVERVKELAKKLGFESVEKFADRVYFLKEAIGLKSNLKDLDLNEKDAIELARLSIHPNLENNPVEINHDMLVTMYKEMI